MVLKREAREDIEFLLEGAAFGVSEKALRMNRGFREWAARLLHSGMLLEPGQARAGRAGGQCFVNWRDPTNPKLLFAAMTNDQSSGCAQGRQSAMSFLVPRESLLRIVLRS